MTHLSDILGRNPVHPFPARMAPNIALNALNDLPAGSRILDPMMGSGTVLAVAKKLGHHAIGVDTDPLAVLMAKVWVTPININKLRETSRRILAAAQSEFFITPLSVSYPVRSDRETREFIRYWYDGYARRQLYILSRKIHRIRDEPIRNALWCAFSRMIVAKESGVTLAMDLSHSRPHKKYSTAPVKPFAIFLGAVEYVIKNSIRRYQRSAGPPATPMKGDARRLPFHGESVDVVLTSPPYLNAIDYFRCSKFTLVWMGYSIIQIRSFRSRNVGTEKSQKQNQDSDLQRHVLHRLRGAQHIPNRQREMLCTYISDMHRAMSEVSRVLKPNGRAVYVIGDCTIRGVFIRNSTILKRIGQSCGLKFCQSSKRILPPNRRYMPPPSSGGGSSFDSRMRAEVVLTFSKRPS